MGLLVLLLLFACIDSIEWVCLPACSPSCVGCLRPLSLLLVACYTYTKHCCCEVSTAQTMVKMTDRPSQEWGHVETEDKANEHVTVLQDQMDDLNVMVERAAQNNKQVRNTPCCLSLSCVVQCSYLCLVPISVCLKSCTILHRL